MFSRSEHTSTLFKVAYSDGIKHITNDELLFLFLTETRPFVNMPVDLAEAPLMKAGHLSHVNWCTRELISVKAKGLIHVWMSWGDSVITETTVDEASIFVSLRTLVADRTIIPWFLSSVARPCKVHCEKHSSCSETLSQLYPTSDSFNHICFMQHGVNLFHT